MTCFWTFEYFVRIGSWELNTVQILFIPPSTLQFDTLFFPLFSSSLGRFLACVRRICWDLAAAGISGPYKARLKECARGRWRASLLTRTKRQHVFTRVLNSFSNLLSPRSSRKWGSFYLCPLTFFACNEQHSKASFIEPARRRAAFSLCRISFEYASWMEWSVLRGLIAVEEWSIDFEGLSRGLHSILGYIEAPEKCSWLAFQF